MSNHPVSPGVNDATNSIIVAKAAVTTAAKHFEALTPIKRTVDEVVKTRMVSPDFLGALIKLSTNRTKAPREFGSRYVDVHVKDDAPQGDWKQYQAFFADAYTQLRLAGLFTEGWFATADQRDSTRRMKLNFITRLAEVGNATTRNHGLAEEYLNNQRERLAAAEQALTDVIERERIEAEQFAIAQQAQAAANHQLWIARQQAEAAELEAQRTRGKQRVQAVVDETPELAAILALLNGTEPNEQPKRPVMAAGEYKRNTPGVIKLALDTTDKNIHRKGMDPKTAVARAFTWILEILANEQSLYTTAELAERIGALPMAMVAKYAEFEIVRSESDVIQWVEEARKTAFDPKNIAGRKQKALALRTATTYVAAPQHQAPKAPTTPKVPVADPAKAQMLTTDALAKEADNDLKKAVELFALAHKADAGNAEALGGLQRVRQALKAQNEAQKAANTKRIATDLKAGAMKEIASAEVASPPTRSKRGGGKGGGGGKTNGGGKPSSGSSKAGGKSRGQQNAAA